MALTLDEAFLSTLSALAIVVKRDKERGVRGSVSVVVGDEESRSEFFEAEDAPAPRTCRAGPSGPEPHVTRSSSRVEVSQLALVLSRWRMTQRSMLLCWGLG